MYFECNFKENNFCDKVSFIEYTESTFNDQFYKVVILLIMKVNLILLNYQKTFWKMKRNNMGNPIMNGYKKEK